VSSRVVFTVSKNGYTEDSRDFLDQLSHYNPLFNADSVRMTAALQ